MAVNVAKEHSKREHPGSTDLYHGKSSLDPGDFPNLSGTSSSKNTKQNFHKEPICFSRDISQIVENCPHNVPKFLHPEPDDF